MMGADCRNPQVYCEVLPRFCLPSVPFDAMDSETAKRSRHPQSPTQSSWTYRRPTRGTTGNDTRRPVASRSQERRYGVTRRDGIPFRSPTASAHVIRPSICTAVRMAFHFSDSSANSQKTQCALLIRRVTPCGVASIRCGGSRTPARDALRLGEDGPDEPPDRSGPPLRGGESLARGQNQVESLRNFLSLSG